MSVSVPGLKIPHNLEVVADVVIASKFGLRYVHLPHGYHTLRLISGYYQGRRMLLSIRCVFGLRRLQILACLGSPDGLVGAEPMKASNIQDKARLLARCLPETALIQLGTHRTNRSSSLTDVNCRVCEFHLCIGPNTDLNAI